ncbi:diguanylate cyclase [Butyrivibrio sp. JL13D10]|uniref:diguanylate cyclase n=1 Tax=Butyrivibrio sp. JL13D10 TaxID=3236815 RepID=UPI0038B66B79
MKNKKLQTCILVVVCIFINLIGRRIAYVLQLPFWLDAVGTILCAIVLGPVGGAVSGVFTNIILGIFDNMNIANLSYSIVSVGIGGSVGIFYPKVGRHNMFRVISTAVFAGLVAVILSTPLNIIFYNGRSGNIWGDGLIDMISRYVNVPVVYSFLGEMFVDIPDKALSVIIAARIIYVYHFFTDRRKKRKTKKLMLWFVCPALFFMASLDAKAIDMASEYAAVSYDTDDGLATMEINDIAQTKDGYIWAGTYAGLYKCDGYKFEEADLDDRISNVMQLFSDRKGRLWIGTNDSGIACYSPKDNKIVFYSIKEGMPSDSIRSICDDKEGNVYVGTATKLCIIHKDSSLTIVEEGELNGVRSLTCDDENLVAGVTTAGELFFMNNGEYVNKTELEDENVTFGAVAAGYHDEFLVGTTSNYAVYAKLEGKRIVFGKKYVVPNGEYFNKLYFSEQNNGYFCGMETGIGFLTREGKYTDMSTTEFNSAVGGIIIDYQGNVWFASNKQGIVRYSWNPFMDVFARAKVDKDVVNVTMIKDGLLYVGTNNGLLTIDLKTYYSVPINNSDYLKGVRIRDIMEDSKGNIWISTYGKSGLIEIRADGTIDTFNSRNKMTEGGRFRSTLELSDGTIVAATTTGLNYIRDGRVIKTVGEKEGLTTQVLSMCEIAEGDLLCGTDGDGIVIVSDGKILYRYGKNDGMESLVILKIVQCGEGEYVYVTSNALYHYKDGQVRKLTHFPYNNCYDVLFTDDGYAWISSSAGIFIVNRDDLIDNTEDYNYSLLNKARGLSSSLTSNSKNAFDSKYLYLCCADGVRRIAVGDENFVDRDYAIRISNLTANNESIKPNAKGEYIIPATSGRITFDIAILNFTLSNPMLHIFLEGAEDEGLICTQKEMQALSYMNLPFGEYVLHVQVYDSAGKYVVRDEKFTIKKESQIFERLYFKVYLFAVCVLFVLFIVWLIGQIRSGLTNVERLQKEAKIDPMTKFWNKTYTEQFLSAACKEHEGILMMIDLDNFKLVNDVYGHEMGDKVLIRFAELIRNCLREDDFVGRIGGDEFLTFILGTSEESAVAEKAKYLNEQIGKVCEELMGKDSSIPLGVSVGAVATADEGEDYYDLFRKADKALYNVKQNGKHGYFMYKTVGYYSVDEVNANGVAGIKMLLEERGGVHKGAYLVDFDKLQMVYRLFARMAKRTIVNIWIVQFVLTRKDGGDIEKGVMDSFVELLSVNLRSNDVVALNGNNQAILILTDIAEGEGNVPIERIIAQWNKMEGNERYDLAYETEGMG